MEYAVDEGNLASTGRRLTGHQLCLADAFGGDPGCTANDVRIANLTLVSGPTGCINLEEISIEVRAELEASGHNERQDIGIYIANDGGDAKASNGTCFRDYLHPVSVNNTVLDLTSGDGPFYNTEVAKDPDDLCGDLRGGMPTYFNFIANITCRDEDEDGEVDVGYCISWDQSKSDGGSRKPSCLDLEDTASGTSSKCKCESINIGGLDFLAPAFGLPPEEPVECIGADTDTSPNATGVPEVVNACDHGGVNLTYSDVSVPGSCGNTETIIRTWTATDECGNNSTVNQTITVVDTTVSLLQVAGMILKPILSHLIHSSLCLLMLDFAFHLLHS